MIIKTLVGWCLFPLGLFALFLILIVSPYDTMGTMPHNFRPSVAETIFYCALASVALLAGSGWLLFTSLDVRRGTRFALGAMFLFFIAVGVARGLWVKLQLLNLAL